MASSLDDQSAGGFLRTAGRSTESQETTSSTAGDQVAGVSIPRFEPDEVIPSTFPSETEICSSAVVVPGRASSTDQEGIAAAKRLAYTGAALPRHTATGVRSTPRDQTESNGSQSGATRVPDAPTKVTTTSRLALSLAEGFADADVEGRQAIRQAAKKMNIYPMFQTYLKKHPYPMQPELRGSDPK